MKHLIAALAVTAALASLAGPALAQDVTELEGYPTYLEKCAVCHGDKGHGDGPAAMTMYPRPRVFSGPDGDFPGNSSYKFRSTKDSALPTKQDLFNVITDGIPGTAMRNFGHLSEQTRWNLVAVIEAFNPIFVDPDEQEDRKPLEIPAAPEITDELIARGKAVFDEQKCYECHGKEGRGDWAGWNDKQDTFPNHDPILPANLTRWHQFRAGHTMEKIFRDTLTGLNGTSMPNTQMSPEDRWAVSAWIMSIAQPQKERQDTVVVAKRVKELPTKIDDEVWQTLPSSMFFTLGQIIQKPRLFWPSVTEVFVQAAYNDDEIVLLVQWDDRDKSEGTNLTEYPPEKDPIYDIFVKTDHPDQMAIQFPTKKTKGSERPYFLWGDKKNPVNLWWWSSVDNKLRERSASGDAPVDQNEGSQAISGEVTYKDGRYRLLVRRSLTTPDPGDVQFEVGKFTPIAFNIWQGTRGEVGKRRAITVWYQIVLEPPISRTAYVAPFLAFGIVLTILLFVVVQIYRTAGKPVPAIYARTFPPIAVAAVAALVLYGTVPGLMNFFGDTVHKQEASRAEEGRDLEFRAIIRQAEKDFSGYHWSDDKKQTVTVPIDKAMKEVLDSARNQSTDLVPAVGPSDKPTIPATPPGAQKKKK